LSNTIPVLGKDILVIEDIILMKIVEIYPNHHMNILTGAR